jgi:hypothetical protein
MLLVLFCTLSVGFWPANLRLVESRNGNMLYRGPEPKSLLGGFAWDSLIEAMKVEAVLKGKHFPKSFTFVDICLLGSHGKEDEKKIAMEEKYFQEHPQKGYFVHYPIYGVNASSLTRACNATNYTACASNESLQPNQYPQSVVQMLGRNYNSSSGLEQSDYLVERLANVNGLMEMTSKGPLVVYFHCTCGCDRTGEFYAAYAMRYLNQSFTEAIKYDTTVPHREIGYGNQVAAEYFCEYLYYNGMYGNRTNDCGNCEVFRCSNETKIKIQ